MRGEIFGDIEDNPSSASKKKHIDAKLRFIRGLIRAGEVTMVIVGTQEQHADVFKIPLWRKK